MAEYRRGAHTVFEIHLHLVWITKYRRPALTGEIAIRVLDLNRDICGQHEVSIMKGHVSKDHVHLLIWLPPQVTISRLNAVAEGSDCAPPAGGVSTPEEAVLGTTPVGSRILLL
jgi:putative transposase